MGGPFAPLGTKNIQETWPLLPSASACTSERENTWSNVRQNNAFGISDVWGCGEIKREMQGLATAGFEVRI